MGFLLLPKTAERSRILGTEWLGYANCVSVFVLFRAAPFSAPESRGARTASACSSLTGGEFFAEPQQGIALCGAREIAAPAAGAKRKGHLRFPFLFELLPFPCFLIWRRFPICDRFENRERQRIFSTVGEHSVLPCRNLYAVPDIVLLHMWVSLRRRGIAVPRNS